MSTSQNGPFSFDLSAAFGNPFGNDSRTNPLGGDLRSQFGGINTGPSPLAQFATGIAQHVGALAREVIALDFDSDTTFSMGKLREWSQTREPFTLVDPTTGKSYALVLWYLSLPEKIADCGIMALDGAGKPCGNTLKAHLRNSPNGTFRVRLGWLSNMDAPDTRS